MDIEKLVQKVERKINPSWPTKYKIRRVYTALGEELTKNIDFFFSLERKLAEKNMNIEDIQKVNDGEILEDYKVTCHSAVLILKKIYDALNIKSYPIETLKTAQYNIDDTEINIPHWIIVVEDDSDPNIIYEESIIADLPLIQQGMMPKHFVVTNKDDFNLNKGNLNYSNEHIMKIRSELEIIDIKTGYITTFYNTFSKNNNYRLNYNDEALALFKKAMQSNSLYINLLIHENYFYKLVTHFSGNSGKTINLFETKLSEIKNEDWQNLIDIVCFFVQSKIMELEPSKELENISFTKLNYEKWLKEICMSLIYRFPVKDKYALIIQSLDLNKDFSFKKWYRILKNNLYETNDVLELLAKLNTITTLCNEENIAKSPHASKTLYYALTSIAKTFLNYKYLPKDLNELPFIPNNYIGYKFFKLFPYIFECNNSPTDFNKMGYYEQVTIIRHVLDLMFSELTPSNCSKIPNYQDQYSPAENRIHILPVLNKDNREYSIVFNIVSSEKTNEEDYYFLYNIKQNTFETTDILDISLNYIIISNRLKTKIEEIEENASFKL